MSTPSWDEAIADVARGSWRRVVVIGPPDVGKSTFIRAALASASDPQPALIDLDPGQKMLGPPGTVGLRENGQDTQLIFTGSSSASDLAKITAAASALRAWAAGRFIANTSSFVHKLGARLQSGTIAALQPDVIVAIGQEEVLKPITDAHPHMPVIWLGPSELARRKSASKRAGVRQAAFSDAMKRARPLSFKRPDVVFTPAPPCGFASAARPVCALAAADGRVICIGVLQELAAEVVVHANPAGSVAREIQLGKMWAQPVQDGWALLDDLAPAWLRRDV